APADNLWLAWVPAGLATLSKRSNAKTARTRRAGPSWYRVGLLLEAFSLEDSPQGMDASARPQAASVVRLSYLAQCRLRDKDCDRALRALCSRSALYRAMAPSNFSGCATYFDLSRDRHGRRFDGAGGAASGASARHVVGAPADDRLSDHG